MCPFLHVVYPPPVAPPLHVSHNLIYPENIHTNVKFPIINGKCLTRKCKRLRQDTALPLGAQLDKVTAKAYRYRAFLAYRGYFKKTRGLKPKVMYWLYTKV
jgi:hypothetical protein